jgi:hypothetical protein
MNTKELRNELNQLKTPEVGSYFAMKQYGGGPDESYIHANRNGIICFTELLLQSIDESNTDNKYEIPIEFYDDESDIVIEHIILEENKAKDTVTDKNEDSIITQIGCAAACLAIVAIFIVGCITSISWLSHLW